MMRITNSLVAWCIPLFMVFQAMPLQAAFEYPGLGWSAATANIKIIGPFHPDKLGLNPTLFAGFNKSHFAIQYQRPYEGLDLEAGSICGAYAIKNQPMITTFSYLGDPIYSEIELSMGSFWRVDEGFHVGTTLNYQQVRFLELGILQSLTFSASFSLEISERVKLASAMEHVAQYDDDISIPQKFHFGGEYVTDPLILMIAVKKEAAIDPEFCMGLLYTFNDVWEIGLGYRETSGALSGGWRFETGNLGFSYSCIFHPELPLSQGIGFEIIIP